MKTLGPLVIAVLCAVSLTTMLLVTGWSLGRASRAPLPVVCRCAP